jgi:hypothetical protein
VSDPPIADKQKPNHISKQEAHQQKAVPNRHKKEAAHESGGREQPEAQEWQYAEILTAPEEAPTLAGLSFKCRVWGQSSGLIYLVTVRHGMDRRRSIFTANRWHDKYKKGETLEWDSAIEF